MDRLALRRVILVLLALSSACESQSEIDLAARVLPDAAEIRLSRDAEYSYNPKVYEITLRGDGGIAWHGTRGVVTLGDAIAEIDRRAVADVWFRLIEQPGLRPEYRRRPETSGCQDHHSLFGLDLRLADGDEPFLQIENAARCKSPQEAALADLADEIDTLAGAGRWVGTPVEIERAYAERVGLLPP